jgi:hypothetical protein
MAQADQAYHPLRIIVELVVISAISAGCYAYAAYTLAWALPR